MHRTGERVGRPARPRLPGPVPGPGTPPGRLTDDDSYPAAAHWSAHHRRSASALTRIDPPADASERAWRNRRTYRKGAPSLPLGACGSTSTWRAPSTTAGSAYVSQPGSFLDSAQADLLTCNEVKVKSRRALQCLPPADIKQRCRVGFDALHHHDLDAAGGSTFQSRHPAPIPNPAFGTSSRPVVASGPTHPGWGETGCVGVTSSQSI